MSAPAFISPLEPGRSIVSWRGNTPQHWQIKRLKWSISGIHNGIWGSDPDGENDLICIRVADFDRNRQVVVDAPPTIRSIEPSHRNNRLLETGDLLIEKSGGGDNQLVGCVVHFDHSFEAVCSNFVARMPPSEGMNSRFLTYLHSSLYSERLNFPAIKQTTGIQNLDAEAYLSIQAPFPPENEQDLIVVYLDGETTQIDALVAEKERMLALLEEKRAALISGVVTRGLNPQAATKPSGLNWLGAIPEHWEVRRGKLIFKQSSIPVRDEDEIVTCFRNGEVTLRRNRREDGFTNAILELGYQGIRSGQLVLHSMDAFAGAIGVSDSDGKCSPEYIICDPIEDHVNSHYFSTTLRLMALRGYIQAACTAVRERAPRIRFSHLAGMFLPLPPLKEQNEIIDFINRMKESTAELEQALRDSIKLLKERRSALITAAVTGKIAL